MKLKSEVLNSVVQGRQAQRGIASGVYIHEDDEACTDQGESGMNDPWEYSSNKGVHSLVWGVALELAFALGIALCWLAYRMIHAGAAR
jgi:hypothetical protein